VPDESDLAGLEVQRARLYVGLSQVGDSCRGTLNAVRRKCGKPNCACARPGHPGHGPQYNLTRWAGGKTVTVHLRPGPELEKAEREVAEYERFKDLTGQIAEVNEAICDARPPPRTASGPPPREGKRGALRGARGGGRRRGSAAGRRGGSRPGGRRRPAPI